LRDLGGRAAAQSEDRGDDDEHVSTHVHLTTWEAQLGSVRAARAASSWVMGAGATSSRAERAGPETRRSAPFSSGSTTQMRSIGPLVRSSQARVPSLRASR